MKSGDVLYMEEEDEKRWFVLLYRRKKKRNEAKYFVSQIKYIKRKAKDIGPTN